MTTINNTNTERAEYSKQQTAIIPFSWNPFKAIVAEFDFTGTEKQIDYAVSLASTKISKVMGRAQMQISNGKMTAEQAGEGMERLIRSMEQVKSAGDMINSLK